MIDPLIVAIVGVTAGGKTEVSERVAAAIGGEIVCADSRQVYRELEIGTGKPPAAERARRPHHLFDALTLEDSRDPVAGGPGRATAGWYAAAAGTACEAIRSRGRIPVLVGGSGLYLRAASRGLAPLPPADPAIRRRLQVELEVHGPQALHQRLSSVDPETAARLGPRDHPRITRALEVIESTGRPLSWWHGRREQGGIPGPWVSFELRASAASLRERIAARTRWMYRNGLCDETRALIERGLGPALLELHAVGYDEAAAALAGELSLAAAEARTVLRTAQLAKRQRTWFRHQSNAFPFSVDDLAPMEIADRMVARVRGTG